MCGFYSQIPCGKFKEVGSLDLRSNSKNQDTLDKCVTFSSPQIFLGFILLHLILHFESCVSSRRWSFETLLLMRYLNSGGKWGY